MKSLRDRSPKTNPRLPTRVIPLLALAAFLFAAPLSAEEDQAVPGSQSPIRLEAGDLQVTFADNTAYGETHRNRYNGISELRHKAAGENLFVPLYAGFNLEHFFGGDFLEELFEPREHPMVLTQVDDLTVRLHQPPPPRSIVESTTTFKLAPPHAVDVTFQVTFHSLNPFKHDYAGLFWASYIQAPEDMKVYFWGLENGTGDPTWVAAYSPKHGEASTHLFAQDTFEPFYVENFNTTLANHYSQHRYLEPFYYGLSGKMVYAILFDRTEGIRFSQSPTGGGSGNPAWDHHWLIPHPEIGKEYSYRARVIYKPFEGPEDIREEFHQWRKQID